jgi:hypothetical protein
MDAHPDDHEVTGTAEMLYMQLDAMNFKTPPPTAERHSYEGPDYKSVLDELRDMMNTERPTGDSAADDTPRSNQ